MVCTDVIWKCICSLSFASFIFAALHWPKFQSTFICTVNPQKYSSTSCWIQWADTESAHICLNVEFNDTILVRFIHDFTLKLHHITEYAFCWSLYEMFSAQQASSEFQRKNEWINTVALRDNFSFLKRKSLIETKAKFEFLCAIHRTRQTKYYLNAQNESFCYREKKGLCEFFPFLLKWANMLYVNACSAN